jgi:hypothetical protein
MERIWNFLRKGVNEKDSKVGGRKSPGMRVLLTAAMAGVVLAGTMSPAFAEDIKDYGMFGGETRIERTLDRYGTKDTHATKPGPQVKNQGTTKSTAGKNTGGKSASSNQGTVRQTTRVITVPAPKVKTITVRPNTGWISSCYYQTRSKQMPSISNWGPFRAAQFGQMKSCVEMKYTECVKSTYLYRSNSEARAFPNTYAYCRAKVDLTQIEMQRQYDTNTGVFKPVRPRNTW